MKFFGVWDNFGMRGRTKQVMKPDFLSLTEK